MFLFVVLLMLFHLPERKIKTFVTPNQFLLALTKADQ